MNIDAKSVKIIKSRFWRNGWTEAHERTLSKDDAAYLAEHGWNFGPVQMDHDDLVAGAIKMSQGIDLGSCLSLLSQSLPSHRLPDRSYLSSVLQAMTIPEHTHAAEGKCPVCGLFREQTVDQDVMLFEKVMWGGIRLTDMAYVWLDLKLIDKSINLPTDYGELRGLLDKLGKGTGDLSASKFAASLKAVKGNKAEREVLCGILGICDILQHPDHPGFLDQYPAVNEREMPNQHFIDLEWPFCWYNSAFGVNKSALARIASSGTNKPLERTQHRHTT